MITSLASKTSQTARALILSLVISTAVFLVMASYLLLAVPSEVSTFFAQIGFSQPLSPTTVSRAVRAVAYKGSLFLAAMVARKTIDLNQNSLGTDSFDSSNPGTSTNGQYDPTKAGDKGDVAANEGILSFAGVGNANIYGAFRTGPGASVAIGSHGAIGTHDWQSTHEGIQDGYYRQDANFTFPETQLPYNSGLPPTSGTIVTTSGGVMNTNYYDHILYSANYYTTSLSGNTIVLGAATLVLPNGLNMSSTDTFTIGNHASISVYSGGTSCTIYSSGVVNQPGYAANFIVYCTPNVTSLTLNGNSGFTGVVVAPEADATMNGSGKTISDFVGCLIANSVTLNGTFHFHYDEALANLKANSRYLIVSWGEIPKY
jgi:hypothetical protein